MVLLKADGRQSTLGVHWYLPIMAVLVTLAMYPEPYRNEALYRYQSPQGLTACISWADSQRRRMLIRKAVKILESPEGCRHFLRFPGHGHVLAYRGLGFASLNRRGKHSEGRSNFSKRQLWSNPRDPELWMALQRNFNLVHGSDAGYVPYSRNLEAEIRGRSAPEKDDDLVGKPLPVFALQRLGGGTLRRSIRLRET